MNQPKVVHDVAGQILAGNHHIKGMMIESNLVAGRQDLVPGKPLVYGQSITDGCIGWDTSVEVLEDLAKAVRDRRKAAVAA
jgi:3-deoxy-7-phosphoheptulonate synthase